MGATDVLAAGGITRPADVVAAALLAGLDLACAAVMLVKESRGGQNVFGRDPGAIVSGGQVTQPAYAAYIAAVKAGRSGRQGVGPTQLTYGPLQDAADARGGCWRWEVNIAVGFEHLAELIGKYGLEGGFRAYNGGDKCGPRAGVNARADRYGRESVALLESWRARLGADGPASSAGLPSLREGDTGDLVSKVQAWAVKRYPLYAKIDLGPRRYGPQTVAFVREFQRRTGVTGPDADGTIIGPRTWAAMVAEGFEP